MAGIKSGLLLGNYQVGFVRTNFFSGLKFKVNGTASFDPTIETTAGTGTWDFGDGSGEVVSNTPTHVYGDTNEYTVTLTLDDMSAITTIQLENDDIEGALDLSNLKGLNPGASNFRISANLNMTSVIFPTVAGSTYSGNFWAFGTGVTSFDFSGIDNIAFPVLYDNASLTSVTFKASSYAMSGIDIQNCDALVTLDLSMLTGLGGALRFQNSALLDTLTLPTSSTAITEFKIFGTKIISCDMSGLTGLGGEILLYNLTTLTSATFPTSSEAVSKLWTFGTNITTLDISGMTNITGSFITYSCPNLTSITNPTTTATLASYQAENCDLGYVDFTGMTNMLDANDSSVTLQNNGMTAAEVNHILVDLDGITDGLYTGRSINIAGTNAAPDTTSGGYDGDAAKTSLIGKGFTVTTS